MENPLKGFHPDVYEKGLTQHKLFMMNMWVLTDPEGILEVLVKNHSAFRKSKLNQRIIEPVSKEGLITTHGKQWTRQRQALAPIFRPRYMEVLSKPVLDVALGFTKELETASAAPIDIKAAMSKVSFDMLSQTLLGQASGAKGEGLTQAANTAIETCGILRVDDFLPLPDWMSRPLSFKALSAIKTLKSGAREVLKEHKKKPAQNTLVSLLLKQEKGQLTENEQVDNLTGFFIAGHETTAIALTWALYLIASHAETQNRLRDELSSLYSEKPIQYEDLVKLPFLKAVFCEVIRLFPSIPIIGREVIEDVDILGQSFKKGETVVIPIYVMHRSERYWSDAKIFDPSRFIAQPKLMSPKNPFYLPFGAGHRVCIGASFAMMESMLLLANLLRSFEICLDNHNVIKPVVTVSLRPNKHIWLRFNKI